MKYNPAIHKRRTIRLKGYDYSQEGLYFITICVNEREMLFGKIENEEMILNDAGEMIKREWEKSKKLFGNIELHEFVVMPNHFHGILEIVPNVGAPLVVAHDDKEPIGDHNAPVDGSVGATLVVAHDDIANNEIATDNEFTPDDDESVVDRATTRVAPTDNADIGVAMEKTLGNIIGAFKSITTVEYIRGVKNLSWPSFRGKLWQRNYYERIIRNEQAYQNISTYIIENPVRWKDDKFYVK